MRRHSALLTRLLVCAGTLVLLVAIGYVAAEVNPFLALGLMLATLLRSEAALIAALVIVSMVLAALGGAWFPLEVTGPTFAAIGHLSPAAWVLDALRAIILRGWSVGQILPYLGAAWGYTVVFLGIALWRFRFE